MEALLDTIVFPSFIESIWFERQLNFQQQCYELIVCLITSLNSPRKHYMINDCCTQDCTCACRYWTNHCHLQSSKNFFRPASDYWLFHTLVKVQVCAKYGLIISVPSSDTVTSLFSLCSACAYNITLILGVALSSPNWKKDEYCFKGLSVVGELKGHLFLHTLPGNRPVPQYASTMCCVTWFGGISGTSVRRQHKNFSLSFVDAVNVALFPCDFLLLAISFDLRFLFTHM